MRREVYLPLGLSSGVILICTIILLLLPTRAQVSLVTDWLWTFLVLLPLVICLIPLAIGAVVLVVAAARLPGMARRPLRRGQAAVQGASDRFSAVTEQIHNVLIDVSARLAAVESFVPLEETPPEPSVNGAKGDDPANPA
jgi:high-affinity K+ transport system ATPase subunit B